MRFEQKVLARNPRPNKPPRINEYGYRSGGSQKRKRRASRPEVCRHNYCRCGLLMTRSKRGSLSCPVHHP